MATASVQATRVAELVLNTDADTAFELFEPVGESRWAPGWSPHFIYPPDGRAQPGAVFARDTARSSFWLVADHDREARRIVYAVFVPDVRITRLEIECAPADGDAKTRARITYTHTSLGEAGDDYLTHFTDDHYAREMHLWQTAIEAYIDGKALGHH